MRVLQAFVLAVLLVSAGCGDGDGGGGGSGGGSGGGASDAPVLTITVAGAEAASWTLDEIEAGFRFATVTIDGDEQSGPLLVDVLAATGVEDWATAEVLGLGEGRSFEVTLDIASADVDEGWVLDVSKRGTLKLAADDLPREQWVRDVAEIRIP